MCERYVITLGRRSAVNAATPLATGDHGRSPAVTVPRAQRFGRPWVHSAGSGRAARGPGCGSAPETCRGEQRSPWRPEGRRYENLAKQIAPVDFDPANDLKLARDAPNGSLSRPRSGGSDEVHVVQPHALAVPAGRLPRDAPLGLGRHPEPALRPGEGPLSLPRLHGPARVCRRARLRRHRLQRASPERLRA